MTADIYVRPGRQTPRPSYGELQRLKELEPFGWTEDGEVIGRSLDDKLDEAYADGVKAALAYRGGDRGEFGDDATTRNAWEHPEQAYRRGYQQGAHAVLEPLRKAHLLALPALKTLQQFVYVEIAMWRFWSRRRFKRHLHKDKAPAIKLVPRSSERDWCALEVGEKLTAAGVE